MQKINVRFAVSKDLAFTSQDHYIPVDVVSHKIDLQEVIIADINEQPVGYLRLEHLWSIVPFIALIMVHPDHRSIGVGKALLRFVLDFLAKDGHGWLYSSSQADEPGPQAWHRHMGFQDCGIITGINPEGVSELFFRKAIGSDE